MACLRRLLTLEKTDICTISFYDGDDTENDLLKMLKNTNDCVKFTLYYRVVFFLLIQLLTVDSNSTTALPQNSSEANIACICLQNENFVVVCVRKLNTVFYFIENLFSHLFIFFAPVEFFGTF